ncbi:MAG: T9SS type A sorting domain-containing protein [bacterium]|nr:T9SS type A sorting domain-containing protein [bacterium]
MQLDTNEMPHIAYSNSDDIFYTFWNGSSWLSETVGVGGQPALVLSPGGNPYISFTTDFYQGELKFGYKSGSVWQTETVYSDYPVWGGSLGLDLDPYGYPHLSFVEDGPGDVFYANRDSTEWYIEAIDFMGMYGTDSALAIDPDGYPHIAYGGHTFKYARWDGSEWDISTISNDEGSNPSIVLDSSSFPHIAYYKHVFKGKDDTVGLRYVYWDGSNWQYDDIDTGEIRNTSIQLDSEGYPHISYWNVSTHKYAYYDPDMDVEYDDTPKTPTGFALSPAYPNPSHGAATISFALPRTCDVDLTLFDIKGRKVRTLTGGEYQAGEYDVEVAGLTRGIYLYRLEAGEFADTRKLITE